MANLTQLVAAAGGGLCTMNITLDAVTRIIQSVQCSNNSPKPMAVTVTRDSDQRAVSHTFAANTNVTFDVSAFAIVWPAPADITPANAIEVEMRWPV